jgi:putative tricarboxylic transport membrane protein
MDVLHNLALGLGVAFAPTNLLYALAGCMLGMLIGLVPGIGPVAAIAMLLPATYGVPPLSALTVLVCIYCGTRYAGATAAILARPSAEAVPVVTAMDGYQMACQGRAGPALLAAALGAFIAGSVGTAVLAALAAPLAALALQWGPVEFFSLMVLGLVGAVVLASGSLLKAMAMAVLGLLLGLVGRDVASGVPRFSFNIPELADGIGCVAIAMGVFAYAEVVAQLGRPAGDRQVQSPKLSGLLPSRQEAKDMAGAILRGSYLGLVVGMLPGGGALRAAFASYSVEKRGRMQAGEIALGKGNIRGVAGPEAAYHAGAQTGFLSLLALGIPSNAVLALLVAAMARYQVQPGPQAMVAQPELFWGLVASLWLAHGLLVVLNLPLLGIGIWSRLLKLPYPGVPWVFPGIVLLCALGVYTTSHQALGVWLVAGLGAVGYLFHKLGCEPAPLLLGVVLGPAMETHLRNALQQSGGDWSVFVTRGLSAGLLTVAALMLLIVLVQAVRRKREEGLGEG